MRAPGVWQWHDEIVKFAPSLKVHVFYSDAAKKAKALQELREADVLITTPHMIQCALTAIDAKDQMNILSKRPMLCS